ncbi:MAG: phage tail protein [Parasutterella sp.]|uniref:phage tail protein n=1 Tax=Parasutterella sp. TaxID=2049037 RepID=UPI0039937AE4
MTVTNYATKWTANAIETPPDLTALVSSGYPTNGDPSKGIPPTLPGAPWFHWVAQSLATVIVGNGLALDQTKTDQLLDALKNFGKTVVPIGSVIFYLGTTIPDGYLLCNGASLSRTEYPELFEVLGTKCGSVDSAHFTLPDTHHRFLEGTTTLSEVGSYVEAGLPNIPGQIYFGRIPHDNYATASSGSWITAVDGAANSNKYQFAGNASQLSAASVGFVFDPSTYNNTYRNVQTVQVDALKVLCLIRSF